MSRPITVLANPPLWDAYAPHLAVPLLAAVLEEREWPVRAHDLSAEALAAMLSSTRLRQLAPWIHQRVATTDDPVHRRELDRAVLLLPGVLDEIDTGRKVLTSIDGLFSHEAFLESQIVQRNALRCVSAAFEGCSFDLIANELYYSVTSTAEVLRAVRDRARNPYYWVFEDLVPGLVADARVGLLAVSVSADTQLIAALTIARLAKEHRPDLHITFGGNYVTRIAERWRAQGHPFFQLVDTFVCYEGEEALPALCEALFEGGSLTDVPGLVWLDGGLLRRNPSRDVDISRSPCPDYRHYDFDRYFAPGPILPIFASRSCAWKCTFCSIPFASNRFRARHAAAIVDEMEELHRRHGSRYFMFVDEIMTIRTLRDVSAQLLERGCEFFWYGETRFANGWTAELAEQLYASGCRRLNFGLESYNQRILDLMRKEVRLEWIDWNLDLLLRAGVPVHLFTILGFPGETVEETRRTIAFAEQTVARSKEHYSVPYSTWGASPFILDLHAPVGRSPEHFGVEIVPPAPEDDLALAVRYRVSSGQSQQEANERARQLRASGVAEPPWFHRSSAKDIEEFTFLRAAHESGWPGHLSRPAIVVPRDWQRHVAQMADDVTCSWSRTGLAEDALTPRLVLYKGKRDYVVELGPLCDAPEPAPQRSGASGSVLVRWLAGVVGLDPAAADDIGRLLVRFGFIELFPPTPTVAVALEWPLRRFCEEASVTLGIADDGGFHIRSVITGKLLALNEDAATVWAFIARQGGVDGRELATLTKSPGARERVGALLETFVGQGFVEVAG